SYSHTVQRTFDAVLKALGDADVIITSQDHGTDVGKVTGTASDGKKVIVDLKATGDKVTEVKVRVGTLGNRERSEYIISKIDARI
ncbi:MAG: DUF3568 family protein, partial [Planctomycetota bacterium]